jgi:GAF domain-containing protein
LHATRIAESRRWITTRPESIPAKVHEFVRTSETGVEARLREMGDARENAVRRWVALNSALSPIIMSLANGQPLETVLQLVIITAAELIGPERGTRSRYFDLEPGPPMKLVPTEYRAGRVDRRTPTDLVGDSERGDYLVSRVLRNESVFVVDTAAEWGNDPIGDHGDYRTFISAPVVAGAVAYGLLAVDAVHPGDLEHQDVDLVNAMAGLVAIAMRNAGTSAVASAENR